MRIMHVTEALGGGVLNVIQQLSSLQSDAQHDVTVVHSIRIDTPNLAELLKIFPKPITCIELKMQTNISPLQDLVSLLMLFKTINKINPDIIHLHSSKAGVLGRIACKLLGRSSACFYTPHGFSFLRKDINSKKRAAFKTIEKISSYFGGTTIACSQSELDHAKAVGQEKAILIENSIPLNLVSEAIGSSSGCRIISSGRLCNQKNPSAFRKIAIALNKEPASFLWIGDGELKNDLLVDGELPENLAFTGWIAREVVVDHLNRSDIFVMTSLWEGMPLALIEAQAAGLPAVVLNVEGCKDIVTDGVTGFICDNTDQMQNRLKQLISDPQLRKKMGLSARKIALQRFAEDRMNSETLTAYARALHN